MGKIQEVVRIDSDVLGGSCTCGWDFSFTGPNQWQDHVNHYRFTGPNQWQDHVNHYLTTHSGKLVHVGQESDLDADGKPFQKTVAVVVIWSQRPLTK
jgi:hypothetical protein